MGRYAIFTLIFLIINCVLYCLKGRFKDYNKAFLTVNGFLLWLLASLRSINTGVDVENYGNIFNTFGIYPLNHTVSSHIDGYMGYRILCKLVYVLSNGNYQVMLSVSAFIIIYGLFKFLYYYSDNAIASVFFYITLYYYFSSFNIVRQNIAISLFLLSIIEFDKKRYIKFALLTIAAISVHNIVALIYVMLLFRYIKWNKILFCLYTSAVVLVLFAAKYLFNIFVAIFPRYARYINAFENGTWGEAAGRKIILSLSFMILIVYALLFIMAKDWSDVNIQQSDTAIKSNTKSLWVCSAMVMIEIVIGVFYPTQLLYLRVQSFFSMFSIILIPAVIERTDKKYRTLLYLAANILFAITSVVRLLDNNSGVFPYEFFFEN